MNTPDFRAAVRRRLPSSAADDEDVVAELAAQLEDAYAAALANGAEASEALRTVETEVLGDQGAWRQVDTLLVRRHGLLGRAARLSGGVAERVDACVRYGRQAARHLRRDRQFTTAASLTLAFCIAVAGTVFTIVQRVLLEPLPLRDPDRVVLIGTRTIYEPVGLRSDAPSYFERRADLTVFSEMAMFWSMDMVLQAPDGDRRVHGDVTTPSLFDLVGVRPLLGRTLQEGDDRPDASRTIVLGHRLWRTLFAADPRVVGRHLSLNGQRYAVVGVMPEGFTVLDPDTEFWIPAVYTAAMRADDRRSSLGEYQLGRLRDGVTLEAAREALAASDDAELERFPELVRTRTRLQYRTHVQPLRDVITYEASATLKALLLGALAVLAAGVLNLATLSTARHRRYRHELAVHCLLGGRRKTIAVHLLAQAGMIAGLGGSGALLLIVALLWLLRQLGLGDVPRAEGVGLQTITIVVSLCAALVASVVVCLMPLVTLNGDPLADRVRDGAWDGTTRSTSPHLRRTLVTAQIGAALAMTVSTALILASVRNAASQDPGFEPQGVFTASFDMPRAEYPVRADAHAVLHRLLDAVRSLPGVDAAGVTTLLPFGGRTSGFGVRLPDQAPWDAFGAWNYVVSPGYFEAMGIPLLAGRYLDEHDGPDKPPVVVIARRLADRLWPGGWAIGAQVVVNTAITPDPLTVVGVVEDVRHASLTARDDYRGATYRPFMQSDDRMFTLVAHASGGAVDAAALAALIDADTALMAGYDARSMEARMATSLAPRRLMLACALVFAIGASLLATVGLYTVLTYLVAERRREFGIRIALGCPPASLRRPITVEGFMVTAAGTVLGLGMLAAAWPLLESHLYGVGGWEAPIAAGGAVLVVATSLLAVLGPARAASGVDPITVLQP